MKFSSAILAAIVATGVFASPVPRPVSDALLVDTERRSESPVVSQDGQDATGDHQLDALLGKYSNSSSNLTEADVAALKSLLSELGIHKRSRDHHHHSWKNATNGTYNGTEGSHNRTGGHHNKTSGHHNKTGGHHNKTKHHPKSKHTKRSGTSILGHPWKHNGSEHFPNGTNSTKDGVAHAPPTVIDQY